MISYLDFKIIFNAIDGEPECEIYFKGSDVTYMIIKYDGYVSFQRCGYVVEGSGEFTYKSLDDLYHAINTTQEINFEKLVQQFEQQVRSFC